MTGALQDMCITVSPIGIAISSHSAQFSNIFTLSAATGKATFMLTANGEYIALSNAGYIAHSSHA